MKENSARFSECVAPESSDVMRRTLHELNIHQFELQMQNEELRRLQVDLEASSASYIDLYDFAPMGYCIVSEQGLILQANLCIATLLNVARGDLVKQPISRFIFKGDQDGYYLHRKQLLESGKAKSCELRMMRSDGTSFWAHLATTTAQGAGGAILLRIALSEVGERKRAEEQLRSLSAQLTMTEERERSLLAQELHDNLGQLLAAIKIKLSMLEASALQPSLDNVIKLVDQADQSVRMIAQRWSSPLLTVLGFVPALEWLGEDLRRLYGLAVHIDIDLNICARPLSDAMQALFFRSVRELLINVAKHAKVDTAQLNVRCDGRQLVLAVRDKGCGFDPAQSILGARGHLTFGLSSIYERMLTLGGAMTIDSRPGHGATITLTMPCATPAMECPRS